VNSFFVYTLMGNPIITNNKNNLRFRSGSNET
jgi:hypothetical protein